MIDYIVVGFGLAGLSFVEKLEANHESFLVFENSSQQSSRVAGGLCNPTVLKRFTLAWQAEEQYEVAIPFYKKIQEKLAVSSVFELPIRRRFNSIEEQNTWFEACDKKGLNRFLSPNLIRNTNMNLDIPYHYGEVMKTLRIDIKGMLFSYLTTLEKSKRLIKESFDYGQLQIEEDYVVYNGIKAKHIVFTEGFGMVSNPFFKYLPLYGNKGEYLIIKSKELQLKEAVKAGVFVIPLGDDCYKVGATYDNKDQSVDVTVLARQGLEKKLQSFLKVSYQVVDQVAGIRPTVKDRRPLLGTHNVHSRLHVFNGLGSRGVLAAPLMAEKLYNYITYKVPLEKEIDCNRFVKL